MGGQEGLAAECPAGLMLCIFTWLVCQLLGTDCFSSARQGHWFIIDLCPLGEMIHYCGQHVSGLPPQLSQVGEEILSPALFCRVWDGPAASTQLAFESQTLIPKLTFLGQFSSLPLGFWCPSWNLLLRTLGAHPWLTVGKWAGREHPLSRPLPSRRWQPGPRAIDCFLRAVLEAPGPLFCSQRDS